MCKNVQEYNTLMRYLISLIIFMHYQRPSVAENMTLQEFLSAKKASDGRTIVLISDHKTHTTGPAQVALQTDHYKLFDLYTKRSVIMVALWNRADHYIFMLWFVLSSSSSSFFFFLA